MQTLWQDLRYGARMLSKKPGFTLIAVLTLALGIGANTAIFSLLDALFLRPPAGVSAPHQLVGVFEFREGRISSLEGLSYPDFTDYRDRQTVFAGLVARSGIWLYLSSGDKASEVNGRAVSWNYFSLLGVKPLLGRFFLPEEDAAPDRNPVAVLSYQFWQSHFGGDPEIVGRSIRMNRVSFTVIGVAPAQFNELFAGNDGTIWVPLMMAAAGRPSGDYFNRRNRWLGYVGRLKPGRTIAEARAELKTLAGQLEAAYPETNRGQSVEVVPVRGMFPQYQAAAMKQSAIFTAVLVVVLLIACANVAGLLVARSVTRRKELAVRLALGAGRWRVVRQLLTESLLLSGLGGVAGLLVAFWSTDLLKGFYSWHDFSLDPLVLGYTLALCVITSLAFGLAPALQATRLDLSHALKDDALASGYRQSRLRAALVIAQVALSLVLLIGAALLIQSLRSVLANPGFDQDHIVHFRLRPVRVGYDTKKSQAFHREVLRRIEALPGVQTAFVARQSPQGGCCPMPVSLPGQAAARPADVFEVENNEITPGYLGTLKIPLVKGRDFDQRDREGAPRVAIVNETLARRLWPDRDALGRILLVRGQAHEVVGVVKDTHRRRANEGPLPFLYLPYWQRGPVDSRLFARVTGDPHAMILQLRQQIAAVDPDVHIGQEMTLGERTHLYLQPERLASGILNYAGLLALLLSSVGLYSMLAHAVSQRTREIGIRLALGAQAGDVLKLVVGEGLKLVLIGMALGLAAALALTRVLSSYLYGITARDPFTFVGVSLLLTAVALLACYLPARRATKVDPMIALRCE